MVANMVVLKNGAEESALLVTGTMMALRRLEDENILAFYELVLACREPNHGSSFLRSLDTPTNDLLRRLGLMESDGAINDSICNIVLSAVEGYGLLTLASPLAPDTDA